jgi:predicted amidohydrolase
MRVAAVQVPSVADGVLEMITPLLVEAATGGVELCVLPEGVMHDFQPHVDLAAAAEPLDGPFVSALAEQASRLGIRIVAGAWERLPGESRPSNTLVVVDEVGELAATYRKIHLFDSFGFVESQRVLPGPIEPVAFEMDGLRVGLMTCYDLRFPELARALAADVLVLPAGWVAGPGKLHHWETLIMARAIENTSYVVAAGICAGGYTGHSMIVDPMGETLARLGDEPGWVAADVTAARVAEVRQMLPSVQHRRM